MPNWTSEQKASAARIFKKTAPSEEPILRKYFIATIENAIDDSIPSDFMITKLRGSCVLNNLDDIFNLLKN